MNYNADKNKLLKVIHHDCSAYHSYCHDIKNLYDDFDDKYNHNDPELIQTIVYRLLLSYKLSSTCCYLPPNKQFLIGIFNKHIDKFKDIAYILLINDTNLTNTFLKHYKINNSLFGHVCTTDNINISDYISKLIDVIDNGIFNTEIGWTRFNINDIPDEHIELTDEFIALLFLIGNIEKAKYFILKYKFVIKDIFLDNYVKYLDSISVDTNMRFPSGRKKVISCNQLNYKNGIEKCLSIGCNITTESLKYVIDVANTKLLEIILSLIDNNKILQYFDTELMDEVYKYKNTFEIILDKLIYNGYVIQKNDLIHLIKHHIYPKYDISNIKIDDEIIETCIKHKFHLKNVEYTLKHLEIECSRTANIKIILKSHIIPNEICMINCCQNKHASLSTIRLLVTSGGYITSQCLQKAVDTKQGYRKIKYITKMFFEHNSVKLKTVNKPKPIQHDINNKISINDIKHTCKPKIINVPNGLNILLNGKRKIKTYNTFRTKLLNYFLNNKLMDISNYNLILDDELLKYTNLKETIISYYKLLQLICHLLKIE